MELYSWQMNVVHTELSRSGSIYLMLPEMLFRVLGVREASKRLEEGLPMCRVSGRRMTGEVSSCLLAISVDPQTDGPCKYRPTRALSNSKASFRWINIFLSSSPTRSTASSPSALLQPLGVDRRVSVYRL